MNVTIEHSTLVFVEYMQAHYSEIVLYGATVFLILQFIRAVTVWLGRLFGFYSPDHFHLWPRLPWRGFYLLWMRAQQWYELLFLIGKRGSTGGFAGFLEAFCNEYRPGKLLLGRASAFGFGLLRPIGIKVIRHIFILAMTGTGKTTAMISMISLWRGSVFVIDPKAQIVNTLHEHDKREWHVFDPHGISNANGCSINFFDAIKEAQKEQGDSGAILWAMRIAEALIVTPSGTQSPYFYEVTRDFLAGLILHVLSRHPEHEHHLPFVRGLIVKGYQVYDEKGEEMTEGDEAHLLLYQTMQSNNDFGGKIAGAVASLNSAKGDTSGNLLSTLQEQTKFLDIPSVQDCLKRSDFSLRDLKRRDDIVLAFTAPIYSLREELSRLSRLLTNMIAYSFEAEKVKKGQCLTIIDELPSQGYNPTTEVMLAVARSMGQTFVGISQNVELMKKHYPNSWKSFIGEADATLWMGGNHPDNAAMLSRILGKKVIKKKDAHTGRTHTHEVDVITTEQSPRFLDPNGDHLIVTRAGGRALILRNDPYFKALPVWKYSPDPDHKEIIWRRIMRKFI